jgi:DNA invertase Pin-like site-specific DNA recombinase
MSRKNSNKQKNHRCATDSQNSDLVVMVPRTFGYARVSTEEQILDVQTTALKAAGCDRIFFEKISAVNARRPEFNLLMKQIERGDILIVHSLSRLGRDVDQILGILKGLEIGGISWRSLTEPHLDPNTAAGRLMINVTSSMAQFERDQIKERTKRGMDERRRQGMYLGRPRLVDPKDIPAMKQMRKRKISAAKIAKHYGIAVSTVYANT